MMEMDRKVIPVSIRALICDELPLMKEGLRALLEAQPDIDVVAATDSPVQAVVLARTYRPDVLLIGLSELDSGLELIRRTTVECGDPAIPLRTIMFHTGHSDEMLSDLLHAGANGLVRRDATSDEVIEATRTVAQGRTVLGPEIVDRLVDWFREHGSAARACARAHPKIATLTPREREVLTSIGRGLSIEDVASELFIGVSTVRTHLHRIRHKLGVKDRAQLVAIAYQAGLMNPKAVA